MDRASKRVLSKSITASVLIASFLLMVQAIPVGLASYSATTVVSSNSIQVSYSTVGLYEYTVPKDSSDPYPEDLEYESTDFEPRGTVFNSKSIPYSIVNNRYTIDTDVRLSDSNTYIVIMTTDDTDSFRLTPTVTYVSDPNFTIAFTFSVGGVTGTQFDLEPMHAYRLSISAHITYNNVQAPVSALNGYSVVLGISGGIYHDAITCLGRTLSVTDPDSAIDALDYENGTVDGYTFETSPTDYGSGYYGVSIVSENSTTGGITDSGPFDVSVQIPSSLQYVICIKFGTAGDVNVRFYEDGQKIVGLKETVEENCVRYISSIKKAGVNPNIYMSLDAVNQNNAWMTGNGGLTTVQIYNRSGSLDETTSVDIVFRNT